MMSKILLLALIFSNLSAKADGLKSQIYGFVEGYVEKVEKSPTRTGSSSTTQGTTSRTKNPHEFDTPHVTLMAKSTKDNYSAFLNLNASTTNVTTRNAWVEGSYLNGHLKMRAGKLYRPFGLYNERLDAVPTYIGIEPPELFDNDHLLLTRTTNFMLHGDWYFGANSLRYALTTGNDERFSSQVPLGGDIRFNFAGEAFDLIVGTSFYFSGLAKPSVAVGSGSPNGGVINWMESDKFNVYGLYTELTNSKITLQLAYYQADHDAKRKGSDLRSLTTDSLTQRQITRLCAGNMSTCADSFVKYKVKTWYIRFGYAFETFIGELTPYVQWDDYQNPETVALKNNGGDNEAGITDDGKFSKQTLGLVFRPITQLAIKGDISNHSQKIDSNNFNYAEIRGSFSYIWSL